MVRWVFKILIFVDAVVFTYPICVASSKLKAWNMVI